MINHDGKEPEYNGFHVIMKYIEITFIEDRNFSVEPSRVYRVQSKKFVNSE